MASVDKHAIVVTSDRLSFISLWAVAGVLLVEVGATLFFAPGIAEQELGGGALWCIVGALTVGFILKSIYLSGEDSADSEGLDFTAATHNSRIVPQQAWKVPLLLQYLVLGPLCGLASAQYIIAGLSLLLRRPGPETQGLYIVLIAIAGTVAGWRLSRSGFDVLYRHSCLRIVQVLALAAIIQIVWCIVTIAVKGSQPLPAFGAFLQRGMDGSLPLPSPVVAGSFAAFGYGLLFLGSLRTLPRLWSQVSNPKTKNIRLAANVVCGYALISIGALTIFVSAMVPKEFLRSHPGAALLGLSVNLAGWPALRGVFGALVLLIAILVLLHAARASFLASASLLQELFDSETLTSWLPKSIQPRSAVSDGSILVGLVYVAAILITRDGFAEFVLMYGFAILIGFWSDTARAVLLGSGWLESKIETGRGRLAGLAVLLLLLSCIGLAMGLSAPRPALWSLGSIVGLLVAVGSRERWSTGTKRPRGEQQMDFQLKFSRNLDFTTHGARPGSVLVAVRDPNRLHHLQTVLEKTNVRRSDIVVMTASPVSRSASDFEIADNRSFSGEEQVLFRRVARLAESHGKTISAFLTVAAIDTFQAMVDTAAALQASRLVTGVSATMDSDTLGRLIGRAWERLPEPRSIFSLEIIAPGRPTVFVNLGPHPPRMWPEDVERIHKLWLELSNELERLHHRDVISTALRLLEQELHGVRRQELIQAISEEINRE